MLLLSLLTVCGAASAAIVQGDCIRDPGLKWLSKVLSKNATIACRGSPGQLANAERYWGDQFGQNASVVVYPRSTQDVSYAMQATQFTRAGRQEVAFVSGGHTMTNSSTSKDFVIDLMWLNLTKLVDYKLKNETVKAIQYGGGTTTSQFETQLNGTGYTGVSARVASVGLGGFSTGGGIGYIAGAYGYACDRLIALEVVLPDGRIVMATEDNEHADLLYAFKGAGLGQFGIITTFYQRAAPTPKTVGLGFYVMADDDANLERSFANTADFFKDHDDPFSLMYYAFAYIPSLADPTAGLQLQHIVATVYFDDPTNPNQTSYADTYSTLLDGLVSTSQLQYNVGYADLSIIGEEFFPYGYRRGFYGPQTTNVTEGYIADAKTLFKSWLDGVEERGDSPGSSVWVLQYMSPGLNGNLPKSDADTAWPHSIAGHQTLFDPGWSMASVDGFENQINDAFNELTYRQQGKSAVCGGTALCDYPNYVSPDVDGRQVWGKNIAKLASIKQKYDPLCLLHTGRVFASPGCVLKGVANVFPLLVVESGR